MSAGEDDSRLSLSFSPMDSLPGSAADVSSPPPPEHPVGYPEADAPPSDHDQDQHQAAAAAGGNQDQVAPVDGTDGLTEDLKRRIIKQVEYYFSDENLPTDKHMISLIKKNKEGFVPISVIASFRKMKKLVRDNASVATALTESSSLVVSCDGKKVKRLNPFPFSAVRDPQFYTVLVENLPEDHSPEDIRRIFGEAGKIKEVRVRDPHAMPETSKGDKGERFISSKLHALVEYETIEAAEKAVSTLNNEQDWRSGLRVKVLKKMVKHGQKKPSWRVPPDSEKIHVSRSPDQTGEEGNQNSSKHHADTPDEENGAHSHKEKNEHKGRNRGRSGRQNHHSGANGMGHGTTRSCHPHEPPKPPPGPRMPDGTRGFTMGRGKVQTTDHK